MENESSSIVAWSEHGTSFRVVNPERFAEEVVPKYFRRKHNDYDGIKYVI
jgi:hypothetical protein